jgi:GNAT superfamily N-acetyltransferase
MHIRIAHRRAAAELASFFTGNLSPAYISHSELQGYRALAPDQWAPNLRHVILAELKGRLDGQRSGSAKLVIEGRDEDELVAVALLTMTRRAAVPHAIIEDLVVDGAKRGRGYGHQMVEWIAEFVRERGIRRIFLESGQHNESAHRFFEKLGFEPISLVMMRDD